MLKPAVLVLIPQVLTIAGTTLVAKGYIEPSDVQPLIGASDNRLGDLVSCRQTREVSTRLYRWPEAQSDQAIQKPLVKRLTHKTVCTRYGEETMTCRTC